MIETETERKREIVREKERIILDKKKTAVTLEIDKVVS
jgi:hypothetical protein